MMEVAKQGYGLDRFNRYMVECEWHRRTWIQVWCI